jgi:GntR family transcriptional regulator/MocR family aminotransferase
MKNLKDHRFNLTPDTPLYQQIYHHLRASILSGEVKGGAKLPSTRALADELGVSRNTTLNAYRQLIAEGYLNSVEGSGTFVAQVLPDHLLTPPGREELHEIRPITPRPPQLSDHARLQLAAPQMSGISHILSYRRGLHSQDSHL